MGSAGALRNNRLCAQKLEKVNTKVPTVFNRALGNNTSVLGDYGRKVHGVIEHEYATIRCVIRNCVVDSNTAIFSEM